MNEDIKLFIPSNVKTRLEFFKGFGIKELIVTGIVALILVPFAILVYILSDNSYFTGVIIEIIGVIGTVIIVTKDQNNLCVAKQIKFMIDFVRNQKKFDYSYYDKWKGEREK